MHQPLAVSLYLENSLHLFYITSTITTPKREVSKFATDISSGKTQGEKNKLTINLSFILQNAINGLDKDLSSNNNKITKS